MASSGLYTGWPYCIASVSAEAIRNFNAILAGLLASTAGAGLAVLPAAKNRAGAGRLRPPVQQQQPVSGCRPVPRCPCHYATALHDRWDASACQSRRCAPPPQAAETSRPSIQLADDRRRWPLLSPPVGLW